MAKNEHKTRMEAKNLSVFYGDKQALYDITMQIPQNSVVALIGPSGCGKSTFLRCLNRMNDTVEGCKVKGKVRLDGYNIYASSIDPVLLRTKVGMVFQKPNPFPKSIYDNVAYGPRLHGIAKNKIELEAIVKESLNDAGLYNEVSQRLYDSALSLSGGQQQRLCIARTIAIRPEVILMDEPCSALDPIATGVIEKLIGKLSKDFTIVMVTHSMQQAKRISDLTAFFHMGQLIEYGKTENVFSKPKHQQTEDYVSGKFG